MVEGEQYTLKKGQELIKKSDNAVILRTDIESGDTTIELTKGEASFR